MDRGYYLAGSRLPALVLKWKDLLLHSFDPAQAQASGLPVTVLHYGLLAALSLTIVATLKAAGLILAIGLLIAPGAIAFLVVRKFSTMLWAGRAGLHVLDAGGHLCPASSSTARRRQPSC